MIIMRWRVYDLVEKTQSKNEIWQEIWQLKSKSWMKTQKNGIYERAEYYEIADEINEF